MSFDPPTKDLNSYNKFYIPVEKSSYVFGLVPYQQELLIDQIVFDAGFSHFRNLEVREERTPLNTLIGVLTLGLWIPTKYYITGEGKRDLR